MEKTKTTEQQGEVSVWFYCPGCEDLHRIVAGDGRWTWNGSLSTPTFSPSVLVTYGHYADGTPPDQCHICKRHKEKGDDWGCSRCHSFVRDGKIEFLTDSTHKLAGQTVEIPEHDFHELNT